MPDHVSLAEPRGPVTPPAGPAVPGADARDVRHAQDAWETGVLAWDVFYLLVFAAVLAIVAVATPGSAVIAGAALAAALPWYLFLGRPLWTGGRSSRARAAVYVTGMFALFAVAQSQNPDVWFLAFALSPQFFSFLSIRPAVALGIGLNFLAAALLVYRYPTAGTAAVGFGVAVAGGGFAVFYSGWVSRIIAQSAERAAIIGQLEATRAELAAAQHEAGRLAERQRIAAEIHDTLAQGFTSILMLIQAAQADLETGGPHWRADRHLDLAARTARENLEEARALMAGLPPAQLGSRTLPDALRRLASRERSPQAGFALDGDPRPLPVATEAVLLRVCQEALANIGKHARARSAAVRLCYAAGTVRLEVSDDGTGFDPGSVSGGYGLRGMRARVTDAGGTLTVRSSRGAGTLVTAVVPG
jgi:signal transduction histidine kinase